MPAKSSKHKEDVGGIVFVGSLFIGLGLGILFNEAAVGVLVGLGVGFILMALIKSRK